MNRYSGPPSKATPSTLCQKCLERGHYSYECKAKAQQRPYRSRPSRTQQLFNPDLRPKLASDTPDPVLRQCVHRTPGLVIHALKLTKSVGMASQTSIWPNSTRSEVESAVGHTEACLILDLRRPRPPPSLPSRQISPAPPLLNRDRNGGTRAALIVIHNQGGTTETCRDMAESAATVDVVLGLLPPPLAPRNLEGISLGDVTKTTIAGHDGGEST